MGTNVDKNKQKTYHLLLLLIYMKDPKKEIAKLSRRNKCFFHFRWKKKKLQRDDGE